ncbi:globin domain-containing protein [Sulfurisphaera javensis]|uniref:Globin domain-containing protein n=1 Tax=Sulfurisphaera javensis TaxID=2049879 RepID=A0AAT9GTA0_9CREN
MLKEKVGDLSEKDIQIIKSTIPVLKEYGVQITSRMYQLLFERYPFTKQMFTKDVSKGLASALLIYAENIEKLDSLMPILQSIARSHVNRGVRPEHYKLVWECLKDSLDEYLDKLNLTNKREIIETWEKAYWFLADMLIKIECELYKSE